MTPSAATSAEAIWARIIPFLRPIEALIRNPDVSDIMVNGDRAVFFERNGLLEPLVGVTIPEKSLQVAARNIARALGDDIDEGAPILDSRLPDGSRVAIVLSPVSVDGTTLTIRKFHHKRYDAEELVRTGTLTAPVLLQLQAAVRNRKNILISGGTGTGKTTLLNALAASIPDKERVVVLEDTAEVYVDKPNLVRFEARRDQQGLPGVTIRDLLKATLRMRPDRILLGEVRGSEAFDFLQAMNTGHQGTLSTIHANSARQSLTRLASCVLLAGIDLPHRSIQENIAEALSLVIHLDRRYGKRIVREVLRIDGQKSSGNEYS